MSYQNPDGTWGYVGTTEKYASQGAANYYGPRDSNYTLPTSTQYTGSAASNYVKTESSSGKLLSEYGLDPLTGTIPKEQLEELRSGYLKSQLINPPKQDISKKKRHKITDEEARERGINRIFGGKDFRKERKAERKKANREARILAGPGKPYATLGYSKYYNLYGYGDIDFPRLPEEVLARDIRQGKLTIMEIGEGGQFSYAPKSVELQKEIAARKNITAQRIAYEKTYGSQNQVSLLAVQAQAENERIRQEKRNQIQTYTGEAGPTAKDVAQQIIQEARKTGATKIEIYQGTEPVGAIKVQGGESALELILKGSGEVSYRFANPEKYKLEHAAAKQQNKDFKTYVTNLQKQGAEIEIRDKAGNLITTVKKNGPVLYQVVKATKKYGEVSVTPKYSLQTVIESFAKVPEEPSTRKINVGFGLDIPIPGQVTGFVEGVKGGGKALIAGFLQPGTIYHDPLTDNPEVVKLREKLESETLAGNIINLQPATKPPSYLVGTAFFDVGLLVSGLRGIRGSPKVVSVKEPIPTGRIYTPIRTPSTIKIAKGFREGKLEYEIIRTGSRAELYQGTELERSARSVTDTIITAKSYLIRKGRVVSSVKPELPPIAQKTQKIIGIGSKGEKVTIKGEPKVKIPSEKASGEAQIPYVKVERGGATTIIRSEPQEIFKPQQVLVEEITPGQAVSLGLEPVKGVKGVYSAKSTPHIEAHIAAAIKTKQLITGTDIFKFETELVSKHPKLYPKISRNPELIKGNKYPEIVRPFVIRTFIGKSPGGYELKPIQKPSSRSIKKGRPFTPSDFSISEGKVGAGASGRAKVLLEKTNVLQKILPETKVKRNVPRDYLGLSKQDQEAKKYFGSSAKEEIIFETVAIPNEFETPGSQAPSLASLQNTLGSQMSKVRSLTKAKKGIKQKQFPESVQSQRTSVSQIQSGITIERTDQLTKLLNEFETKMQTKLKTPTKTRQLPKVLVTPISIVGQKPVIIQIEKQKQTPIQKQMFKEKPPQKPPKETTGRPPKTPSFEFEATKKSRSIKAELEKRSEFIGNASEVSVEGLYKRSEIIYGSKKVSKLSKQDIKRFVKIGKERKGSIFGKSKSKAPKATKQRKSKNKVEDFAKGPNRNVTIFSKKSKKKAINF